MVIRTSSIAFTVLSKAIDEAIAEEAATPDAGVSLALPARRRPRRHHPSAQSRRTPHCLQYPCRIRGDLRAGSDCSPALSRRGLRQAPWPDRRRASCSPGHGAWTFGQGVGRGIGNHRDDGQDSPSTDLRQDRHFEANRANASVHVLSPAHLGCANTKPIRQRPASKALSDHLLTDRP
jgi:hypothetical protein